MVAPGAPTDSIPATVPSTTTVALRARSSSETATKVLAWLVPLDAMSSTKANSRTTMENSFFIKFRPPRTEQTRSMPRKPGSPGWLLHASSHAHSGAQAQTYKSRRRQKAALRYFDDAARGRLELDPLRLSA